MQPAYKFVTKEQVEKMRPFLPDIDDLIKEPIGDFLLELDDAIIFELDEDYETTPNSRMLQRIYDEVYMTAVESANSTE